MTVGLIGIFAGYAIASYGVCLVKGYDIPWRSWINPLAPWSWPAKGTPIPTTPPTSLFPA